MNIEIIKQFNYKGSTVEINRVAYVFGSYLTVVINGKHLNKGPNLSVEQAEENAKEFVNKNLGVE